MHLKRYLSAILIAALVLIPAGPVLAQEDESIVEIAVGNDDFSTLVAALTAAGLVEVLASDGPFTVFAPTNDAFAELEGLVEELLEDPEGDLTQILLYHVISGVVLAEDISDGLEAQTVQGEFVVFTIDGDAVQINHADIVDTNILASNGVIHVINRVLLPPALVEDEPSEDDVYMEEEEMVDDEMMEEEATEEVAEEEVVEEEAMEEEAADEETIDDEAEMAEAGDIPAVTADDQTSDGMLVTVSSVTATQAGWIVIHVDADGAPGAVIGQTAVPAGTTDNVIVFLEEDIAGETALWAMLHVDEGEPGVYEFPGPDVPVRVNDVIVMAPFTASAPEAEMTEDEVMEEEMVEEEMVEEEETMDEEAMEEEAVEEEEMTDEEMTEDEAPETLPATGGSMTGTPLAIGAAMMVLLALAAVSIVNRRRLAS